MPGILNNNDVANAHLLTLIKQQKAEGRNAFYKRYACVLYGIIKPIITECHDSEKVLQQTFDQIFAEIDYYKPECGSFLTWAMQVARSTSIAYLCGAKQVQQPGYLVHTNSDIAQVELLLLPNIDVEPTDQDVLAMVLQGCKAHEVADKLKMPVEAVKMKIRKAMLLKANRA